MSPMLKTESGLEYEDVKGIGGAPLKNGQVVRIEYKVALTPDDLVYARNLKDTSEGREDPLIVTIGKTRLLRGVEEGMVGMRKGDTRWLKIPPDLAYGKRG